MREVDYWLWLSSLAGLGPVKARRLLEVYGHPQVIYHLPEEKLKQQGLLTPKNIEEILGREKRERIDKITDLMLKKDIKLITFLDKSYPEKLKHIYDPPVALYYRGSFALSEFSVAVVGSRRTTNYGSITAKKLSYELALRGVQIVSGMARGIDSIAHEGCLDAGGKTVAVLGCGPDYIYPPENARLYEGILGAGGLILSEYPPGTPPMQYNFPARNRIISGISSGVLIVEAAQRSGSLITAALALEQGREVFAVPGNIDCAYSRGTNSLIREGAKIVLGVEDILEEFDYREEKATVTGNGDTAGRRAGNTASGAGHKLYFGLSTGEIRVIKTIQKGIHHIDEIIQHSNISISEINNILFMLEMKGVVAQMPGKFFELCP
ncbi:hypothetical protein CLHUN_15930 [Ruminiclostridium hungatei]|uniref:Uncharacterized protein n=1 Tax=Ruminiclostridium hungatei TaxID=48256 RepID=A0A1V4SL28_RUMHU|nr:DNA-processing protein DprA [Ruminiclostridium hungatei]OPX44599.1 hypothetical protein CLHUN_15930 [Ruminiclostridium hungatei]